MASQNDTHGSYRLITAFGFICLVAIFANGLPITTHAQENASLTIFAQLAKSPADATLLSRLKQETKTATNESQKVHYAVTYCLACFFTGQNVEASKLRAYLQKTFPAHPDVSLLGNESIMDECQTCAATGRQEVPCQRCRGSGQCPTCAGVGQKTSQGFDNKTETRTCASCGGSGTCRDCNGQGKTKTSCANCAGRGYLFSETKIKTVYLAILNGPANSRLPIEAATPPPDSTMVNSSRITSTPPVFRLLPSDAALLKKAVDFGPGVLSINEMSNLYYKIHVAVASLGMEGSLKVGQEEYNKINLDNIVEYCFRELETHRKQVAEDTLRAHIESLVKTGTTQQLQEEFKRLDDTKKPSVPGGGALARQLNEEIMRRTVERPPAETATQPKAPPATTTANASAAKSIISQLLDIGGGTKDEWKAKLRQHFTVAYGNVIVSTQDKPATKTKFKRVMGAPDKTQTIGESTYWYFKCKDGVIQLVIPTTEFDDMNGTDVNDY